jgi:hypothetical protein
MIFRSRTLVASLALLAFASPRDADARHAPRARAHHAALTRVLDRDVAHDVEPDHDPAPDHARLVAWLRARAPEGVEVVARDGQVTATYVTRAGDTLPSIARALLPLSSVYARDAFTERLVATNHALRGPFKPGTRIEVPDLVDARYAHPDGARLGWPKDEDLRGVYVRGTTAGGGAYTRLLDAMVEHGMNAIVLDTKDTDGVLTYPSKVPLAVETGATKDAPIADLARAIRFAHARGVRVVMRVSCFHDEWMQHHKGKEMSVRGKAGGIYPIGWLDPANEAAHEYLIAIAKEAMDAGADEIELDYVRYPVTGIKNADFRLDRVGKTKTEVIRDFVREVHAVTHPRGVPLSLDIFGVVATGHREDIDMLGQDIAMLAPECEVLSPMVYPSHYAKGFHGFDVPGNHPELVGIGTAGTIEQMTAGHALVRPWVQAMNWESPDYGPRYLAAELKSATDNGSSGWLMWNPQQEYGTAWAALPRKSREAVGSVVHGASGPERRLRRAPDGLARVVLGDVLQRRAQLGVVREPSLEERDRLEP